MADSGGGLAAYRAVGTLYNALMTALVPPVLVIVRDELAQDGKQVARTVDQHPLQAL